MLRRGSATVLSLGMAAVLAIGFALTPEVDAGPPDSQWATTDELVDKLSPELVEMASEPTPDSNAEVRVIVRTRATKSQISDSLGLVGGRVESPLPLIDGYVASVPRTALQAIASDDLTDYVSLDREIKLLGDRYDYNLLRVTTGAENVIGDSGLEETGGDPAISDYLKSLPDGPNGSDISIAILDSGIYDQGELHEDLRAMNNPSESRILTHQNFVSSEPVSREDLKRGYDPYGHGTHVAGVAAGSGLESIQAGAELGNLYAGLAFNANLVDLRVIGVDGSGYISDTIAAIDWMIRNRARYNIRVANFSIGAAVTQSYKTDPLCQAVERAVSAGIVCVVAAGNFGKDSAGSVVYGGILAPANDPMVITVGATNTWGSSVRSDDTIASYSSRGPTLVDHVSKPDLVAPGTLIRSIAANKNALTVDNNLTVYSREGEDVYMWLSGTSVAAPVVSGAAALMLDVNPGLTPAAVKSMLQFSAQQLPSLEGTNALIGMLTQGAGYLNVDGAVRLAQAFDRDIGKRGFGVSVLRREPKQLERLLYSSQNRIGELTSSIANESVVWGNNVFFSHGIAYFYDGNHRLSAFTTTAWQVTPGFRLLNGYVTTEGRLVTDGRLASDGRIASDGRLLTDGRLVTDGRVLTDGWVWMAEGDGLANTSAVQSTWSANLLDQSTFASGVVFDLHALERVIVAGDDAPGFEIVRITSKRHHLFPRGKRNRV